jgi:GGDEF domain-containing protein
MLLHWKKCWQPNLSTDPFYALENSQTVCRLLQMVKNSTQKQFDWLEHDDGQDIVARQFVHYMPAVDASVNCDEIIRRFHDDPTLNCIAVINADHHVIGVLRSLEILRRGTEGFFHELTGRRSCTRIMDPDPLVFDVTESLLGMSKAVAMMNDRHLVDGFFVTEKGKYIGVGYLTDVIKAVTKQQISFARYANPLTLLPGNVPIDQRIQACLSAMKPFVVGYFDLDNFKAYNDVYGYRAGDEVIQLAAEILKAALDESDDFLGHVGGDDFVTVFTSMDWELRVQLILRRFDHEILSYFSDQHILAGGLTTNNRQGVEVFHRLVSLSAGMVRVAPGEFSSPAEISSNLVEAKKRAKQIEGSSYFLDRRSNSHKVSVAK